jgi:hypothetical protein
MRDNFKKVIISGLGALSVAGALLVACGASNAASPTYCAQYARLAIHEVQVNMATPGCFKGFDNTWHLDYQRHYSWCLTADVASVNAQRDYRRSRVYQCEAAAGQPPH